MTIDLPQHILFVPIWNEVSGNTSSRRIAQYFPMVQKSCELRHKGERFNVSGNRRSRIHRLERGREP